MARPGGLFYGEFTTSSPSTGGATDADSTPVAVATRNGADDSGFALTVTRLAAGRYSVGGVIPAGYADGDWVSVAVTAAVGGISGTSVLGTFQVVADAAVVTPSDPGLASSSVAAAIGRPKRVMGDAGEVEQHPIPDLIAAEQYLAAKAAADGPGRGLRFSQLVPDGTVSRRCGRDRRGW